jgi:hypothetical protein
MEYSYPASAGLLDIHVDIRKRLYNYYINKKIPHLLFYGEHGCGKKTIVTEFINLIYGGDRQKIKQNTLSSICSHSKGIKHIRENLKEYSRSNVRQEDNIYFKTIILYNFENLSSDGQSALRRVIESYSNTTRFILVLQNKEKILQPILSRFAHIYVPFPIINGAPVNLHRHFLPVAAAVDQPPPEFDLIRGWMCDGGGTAAAAAAVDAAEKIYAAGFSCIDLLDYLKKHLSGEKMAELMMTFQKVKSEFRNEKMMILYISAGALATGSAAP